MCVEGRVTLDLKTFQQSTIFYVKLDWDIETRIETLQIYLMKSIELEKMQTKLYFLFVLF